jgi:hypothetical protein
MTADIQKVPTDEIEAFEKFYADGFPFTGAGNPHHFDSLSKCIMFEAWQARAILAASDERLSFVLKNGLPDQAGGYFRYGTHENVSWHSTPHEAIDAAIAAGKAANQQANTEKP